MKLPENYVALNVSDSKAGGVIHDVAFSYNPCPLTKGCTATVQVVAAASIEGGLYGGPEPKYFHQAEPGEILHVHQVECSGCGNRQDYNGDGVHTITTQGAN